MIRSISGLTGMVILLFLSTVTNATWGAVPSEVLLPRTTKAFISVADLEAVSAAWNKMQLGQLMSDPAMKPFVEDFERQIRSKFSQTGVRLGVAWEDLRGVASGEVAVASIQPNGDKTRASTVLTADVTGRLDKAQQLLDKISKNQIQKGATTGKADIGGVNFSAFKLPKKKPTDPMVTVYYAIHQNQLIAVDDAETAGEIIKHFTGAHETSLKSLTAFEVSQERTQEGLKGDSQIRWFIEPFGYVEVSRAYAGGRKKRGTDMLKVLATQGFDAIQGVGGRIALKPGDLELQHQTFIYAPPLKHEAGDQSTDRYKLAARMLDFPNTETLHPQGWVPQRLGGYVTFNWKMKQAFWNSETLVNEIAGDDVFQDVIKSIETDPNGPRINVGREFVQFLGERATIISDYREPVDTRSERVLMAIEVTDPQSVMATVNKAMKSDPDAKLITVDGHSIWEMTQEETFAVEEINIDGAATIDAELEQDAEEEEEKKFRPNAAVTVAHGHLLIATRVDYLVDMLKQPAEGERLSDATDFQKTMAALKDLGAKSDSCRVFTRTDHASRVTYEMVRQNKMPEAESLLGKALNELFAPEEEDTLRDPKFDGTKLPEFDKVKPYLGPAGMFLRTEDLGWSVSGCLLAKPQ